MSGEAIAAPQRGGADKWLPLASFATCTFYVFLLGFLTLWVIVPTAIMRWDPMVVSSGSMSPLIRVGDIVLIDEHDGQNLDSGSVITYRDASRDGELVTHRIAALNEDGTYTTKGDANQADDPAPVHPGDIEGVGKLLVPMIGIPLTWLSSNQLTTFLIWTIMTLVAVLIASRTPEDHEDEDDLGGAVSAEAPRPGPLRRALRLVNLPGLLRAAIAPLTIRLGGVVGPSTIPSHLRAWAPTVAILSATLSMGGDLLGTLVGATSLTVALAVDPKGPEIRLGRWIRTIRRVVGAARRTVWRPDDLAAIPVWRPALAGVAIVAVLAISVIPRTDAAFSATTSNSGNSWTAGTWTAAPPSSLAIPACGRQRNTTEVELTWNGPSTPPTPTGYRIERSTPDTTGPWTTFATTSSPTVTSHTATGLANNVWYYFRVRSLAGSSVSAPSNVVGVRIIGTTCEYYPAP